jgi:hypothetical protein
MSEAQNKPTPEELLQAKDRVLEQWRLLPAEHQATMFLVLLKELDSADMRDWVLNAVTVLYSASESSQTLLPVPIVSRTKLAELNIDEAELAKLTDSDLITISERIQAQYAHDEFWDELMLQVLEFHTEQVLKEKHR